MGGSVRDNKGAGGCSGTVRVLLACHSMPPPLKHLQIDVVDLRHVGELHQAVGGQNFIRRRVAEPGKAAAWNLKGEQALIAVGNESFGFGMYLGSQFLGALHVIKCQNVRLGAGWGLFEATTSQ